MYDYILDHLAQSASLHMQRGSLISAYASLKKKMVGLQQRAPGLEQRDLHEAVGGVGLDRGPHPIRQPGAHVARVQEEGVEEEREQPSAPHL